MAKMGGRGRGMKPGKPSGLAGFKEASSLAGPAWKPAKSSVSGNYGKAVSAAAHARNAARGNPSAAIQAPPPMPSSTMGPKRLPGPNVPPGPAPISKRPRRLSGGRSY